MTSKTKEEMQKICSDLSKEYGNEILLKLAEYGNEILQELAEHLGSEENFDPDEGCEIWSCSRCGACPSGPDNMVKETKLKQTYAGDPDEGERPEWLWKIECSICGFVEEKEGPEAEL